MEPEEATLADVHKLVTFFLQAWSEAGPGALGFTGTTEKTIREVDSEEFLKERLSNPYVKMHFVEDGGKILGFAATRRIDENTIELSGIIVLESATGKGIGTELVKKVISSASQVGFRKIVVKTEVFNQRAIGFYTKMGFAEVGKTSENVEGTSVDVVVLEKALR
jgi:N-acetylglutamate synthase-like GNAT family acetyltransferase